MLTSDEKKALSEKDICTKYITPAVLKAGWDIDLQIREEVTFTKGRIVIRGKLTSRGKSKRADYILYLKPNIPLAIIEAKDNKHPIGAGMQQALEYGDLLDIPFVYSSNGDGFIEHDRTRDKGKIERELALDEFPSPDSLWERYCTWKGFTDPQKEIISQAYYIDGNKEPRYYQRIAINRVVEAIAKGQDRILLVMATGCGKTQTAFQIIYRLWKAGIKKRILFLADRNILVDQAKTGDFKPFGSVMAKITSRKIDKSYEVFLALYQQLTGPEESQKAFKEFTPDFFDLIVIDECHRGSAAADSAWREILEYFSGATQIGLTATPKETKYVSNIDYFGEPLYSYSLRQGIQDGFLAPYRVVRIDMDKDLEGWRPSKGQRDKHGNLIEDRIYNQKDFDRQLVLDQRTELVARLITEFLEGTNPFDKTIVFCEDIEHAGRMRQALINENPQRYRENQKYIMQITGDNPEGKEQVEYFQMPEEKYPVIATTSRLLTTGVDVRTCKLIVLDQTISSMTEFKQIIGRGTRVEEDYGKTSFTIMDFKKATELFADPNFDGDPVQIYEPGPGEPPVPPDVDQGEPTEDEIEGSADGVTVVEPWPESPDMPDGKNISRRRKFYVKDVLVQVVGERVQYYDKDGKLITESLKDYTRKAIQKQYRTLNEFLKKWTAEEKKQAVIEELEEEGVLFEALADEVGRDYEAFDLICHVAYGQPPLTRHERAQNVKKRNYFGKYTDKARIVLEALLDKYADRGITELEKMEVLKLKPMSDIGTPVEIIQSFGGKDGYRDALRELESHIYETA
ncbi:MAG: DEAD/DEAH box helicase family protein [Spirochaetales bacterium]|nr:DEAD/DEAH box helicase family protein [Spirochaetales bacterium]